MELFQRLILLADQVAGSQAQLAKAIEIPQGTFHGYLSEEGQRKIRFDLLTAILRAYPQVNRDWLFFGEGEMLGQGGRTSASLDKKDRRIAELEVELKEERRLNRRLTAKLLDGEGHE